eukprot:1988646-Rhodomonas_salina.1
MFAESSTSMLLLPELIDGEEEYVVEEIIAHRGSGSRTQHLVRWASYGPEDDEWLPKRNLANADA